MTSFRGVLLASAVLLAPTGAFAADTPVAQQIEALQQRLRALQQEIDALKAAQDSAKNAAPREANEHIAADTAVTAAPAAPHVGESAAHKFSLESGDGRYSVAPNGVVQIDIGGYLNYK